MGGESDVKEPVIRHVRKERGKQWVIGVVEILRTIRLCIWNCQGPDCNAFPVGPEEFGKTYMHGKVGRMRMCNYHDVFGTCRSRVAINLGALQKKRLAKAA